MRMSAVFERTALLYGAAALARFATQRVAVVGIGGVGSYAAEALARAGIGTLVLVDDDRIEPSNINRQVWALHSTCGQAKVAVARARLLDINPALQVIAQPARCTAESVAHLLDPAPDFVIDAIDAIACKVALLAHCVMQAVPVIACMGAAGRTDPTRVRYADIADRMGGPFARRVRTELAARGIARGLPIVCSDEAAVTAPRGQPLPSGCAVPAAVGLAAAAYVLARLASV
jgi:tRNA A37 threonylcarbamoyladenosine dehydratase